MVEDGAITHHHLIGCVKEGIPFVHPCTTMWSTPTFEGLKEISVSNSSGSHFAPTRILVPVDFSPSSDAALETAIDLALHYKAQIYLLHVVPVLTMIPGTGYPTDYFPEGDFLKDAREHAGTRLTKTAAGLVARGVSAQSGVESGNDVVGNIMLVIEREKSDFVVLSTHGISGWRAMVFGSIAEKLVKLVQCPLLLLRSVKDAAVPVAD
jgi:nucleotide-binding universal stress UspA family protein